jgi:hypothetical protein
VGHGLEGTFGPDRLSSDGVKSVVAIGLIRKDRRPAISATSSVIRPGVYPRKSEEKSMKYLAPGLPGSIVEVAPRYENFIGGKWLAPTHGKYRVDLSPATARPITEVAESTPEDVELALDAAHAAKDEWGEKSATGRAEVLNAIADAVEANKEMLAVAESWENGKPVRETLAADIPLVVDHFRYFAAAARAEESRSGWSGRSSRSTSRC